MLNNGDDDDDDNSDDVDDDGITLKGDSVSVVAADLKCYSMTAERWCAEFSSSPLSSLFLHSSAAHAHLFSLPKTSSIK